MNVIREGGLRKRETERQLLKTEKKKRTLQKKREREENNARERLQVSDGI